MNTFHKMYIIGRGALHTMDRRQKKTRQAIIDAFVKLLTKTSYEKVSVKEIIDAANVGRSTFYSHFETKDDLARQICFELFDHIFSPVIPPCSTHNFSDMPQNTKHVLRIFSITCATNANTTWASLITMTVRCS